MGWGANTSGFFGYSPLAKSKGREMGGGETRTEFISVRPTLDGQWTKVTKTVSKVWKDFQVYIRKMGTKAGGYRKPGQ